MVAGICASCLTPMPPGSVSCPKCHAPVGRGPDNPVVDFGNQQKHRFKIPFVVTIAALGFIAIAVAISVAFAGASPNLRKDQGTPALISAATQGAAMVIEVPNAVGNGAWDSYKKINALGMHTFLEDSQGNQLYKSGKALKAELVGQFVCYQDVLAGLKVPRNKAMTLAYDSGCKGKTNVMLSGAMAAKSGLWTPAVSSSTRPLENTELEGWVVGHGDEYQPNLVKLLTIYGEVDVNLALIEPLSNWCDSDALSDSDLLSEAMDSRDRFLPIGTPIKAVLSSTLDRGDALFHRLGSDGAEIDGEAPANSVNELLVSDGSWMPDTSIIEESSNKVAPAKRKWKIAATSTGMDVALTTYFNRILSAANNQRIHPENAMASCMTAASQYWLTVELPAIKAAASAGGGGGSGGSGGVSLGYCYVNGYMRGGHYVRGYYRRC